MGSRRHRISTTALAFLAAGCLLLFVAVLAFLTVQTQSRPMQPVTVVGG